MAPRDPVAASSHRRRPSLSFRTRPRTATISAIPSTQRTRPEHDIWSDLTLVDSGDAMNDPVLEDVSHFPEPAHRRRGAKSFSSLRHPVEGLRALGRRLSVTLRNKTSRTFNPPHHDEIGFECPIANGDQEPDFGAWPIRNSSIPLPIPGNGSEPPVLPNDMYSGAAARAAAAAQNEMARKMDHMKLTHDSESGIGINLDDHSESSDLESDLVRVDPLTFFPTEIMARVLSNLDPDSLMSSQLVSRAWSEQASSKHIWRHVFRRCYGQPRPADNHTQKLPSTGLGKSVFNQDWKKLFLVRRALDQRWKDGKAAAIYLQGHTDSVYCVQFDEDKIITGSRDRTIRVWDARYPWPCRKIIGPPPGDVSNSGPVHNPEQQSSGKSPFLTIRPPPTRSAEIVDLMERPAEYHSASILCLQYDNEIMVTGSSDFSCIVWDMKNDYRPIRRLEGHTAGVLDICFDDRHIVSCSKDHTICVWDRHTGALVKQLLGHRGPVNAVQLRGDLLVSASGDGVAKLWNISSGQCVKEFSSKDRGLACVEFSHDARTVLTGGNDRMIYQFDANSGELAKEIQGHTGLVRSLHLDSVNQRIVSGSYDMSVKVFDSRNGELSIDFPGWTTSWMLSVKSDYRRIVATSQDSRAVIMDFGYGIDGIDLLEEAALCQIFDSIFMDVPMSRVKFNVNTEYAYLQNFKILQNVFARHAVDKPIPVESLSKCRMQDNLEFLQWTKKYWDQHYPGGDYDAVARRKASGAPPAAAGSRAGAGSAGSARRGTTPTIGGRPRPAAGGAASASVAALQAELATNKEAMAGLEKERDFYFAKLRDIELLLQNAIEADPELEKEEDSLVKHIQGILYSTEEGFEIPAEAEGADELETF
ncbi:WD40-repeat-containing domain protein [Aspergillus lucknowensis]|uniref:Probable E3 ubiquitin ligase complex SCF subunit sconB n=1 Tax=Aspergillus lucknowensis TaxID=176173 RepID=A0ABR4LSH0_9EURO